MGFDWGKIGSGPKFNELVSALLRQEDHRTYIFNRDGKDGAIDALSGDKKTIIQVKYHFAGKSAQAFADAKKELKKIQEYQTVGHRWHAIWKDVTTWRLVTNVAFGPQDELQWQSEVVPEFAKRNLAAEYRTSAHLQIDLIGHRDIADAFFGDRPRLFVSLQEHREALVSREVLERAYDLPLEGRDEEMALIREFVENSHRAVLLIEGEGGVGKSRLQYEAASTLLDEGVVDTVYCGTPHLAASQDWYVGIVPEAKALVLIDDPTDADFVERFLYELRSRTREWKAIITVRSQRDPVIRSLRDPRESILAQPIILSALNEPAAVRLAIGLLQPLPITDENRPRAEKWLAKVCGRFPIWMTVATQLLETRTELRELPEDRFGIAQKYVSDIVRHTRPEIADPPLVLRLLRWIALTQPVNRYADGVLAHLAVAIGMTSEADVGRLLVDLAQRRAITFFGVDQRMVEIRPDVFRDHLLMEWLTFDDPPVGRQPTADARRVAADLAAEVLEGRPSPLAERIVNSLARLEFNIEPRPPFLNPLADAALRLAEDAADTLAQRRALKVAGMLAPLRPRMLARVAELVRTREVPVGTFHTMFRDYPVSRSEVRDELPWELFRAAHGAMTKDERKAILRELAELVDLQPAEGSRLSTGRSAAELLRRVLHERRNYRTRFNDEAAAFAADALNRIEQGEDPRESWGLVLTAMAALERQDAYQSSDNPNSVIFETYRVAHESALGSVAVAIRLRLWTIAAKPGPFTPARKFAWPIIHAIHGQLNRNDQVPEWHALLIDDLNRCLMLALDSATQLEELQVARAVWAWHCRYEKDPNVRPLADECETAYLKHPVVTRYATVFGASRLESEEALIAAADSWPTAATSGQLEDYLKGALVFTRTHAEKWREMYVYSFVRRVGAMHCNDSGVREFVENHMTAGSETELFSMAVRLVHALLFETRKLGDEAVGAFLEWLEGHIRDEASCAQLLASLYADEGYFARDWTRADRAFMEKHWNVVSELPIRSHFFLLGRRLRDESEMQDRVTAALRPLNGAAWSEALHTLWGGFNDMLQYPYTEADIPAATIDFLLGLLMIEPDLDARNQADWEIEQLLQRIAPKSLGWVVELVRQRIKAFGDHNKEVEETKCGECVLILPGNDALILHAVAPLADEIPSPEAQAAVRELFQLFSDDPSTVNKHCLPQLLAKLDPHGRAAPQMVAEKLRDPLRVPDVRAVSKWARFAGWYRVGSPAWRIIASVACQRVFADGSEGDRHRVFSSLESHRMRGWTGSPGELHPRFQKAIDRARTSLEEESDPALKPFWEWRLVLAERDLKREEGEIEEGDDF